MLKKISIFICLLIIILMGNIVPAAHAQDMNAFTEMNNKLSDYIRPWQGKISLRYQNLLSNKSFSINSQNEVPAASTIKLPLALYVMKLADAGQLDLSERMTYQSHHYSGGSGVIQNDPIGTNYTISELIEKAMVYSDNIAFIMLKERVGKENFVAYLKELGAVYAYPGGRNTTSADDLNLYAQELFRYSRQSVNGQKLLNYLEHTVYNTTIPMGIHGKMIAHKVGMIPMNLIYNDTAVIFDKQPYTLSITTKGIGYEKSQEVIAEMASIVDHYHVLLSEKADEVETVKLALSAAKYHVPSSFFGIGQNSFSYLLLENTILGRFNSPAKYKWNVRNNSFHQQWVFLQKSAVVKNGSGFEEDKNELVNTPIAQSN